MKILHLIPTLDYTGAAAQLGLLAKHAAPDHCPRVCCLGAEGPWARRLRNLGRRVDCLSWTRAFDPTPLWQLRRLLNEAPSDLIHVWGLPVLRSLGLVGRRWLPRTIVSQPLPAKGQGVTRLDRWLLRRVRTVAASSHYEATRCTQIGVAASNLAVMPPGVEVPTSVMPPVDSDSPKQIMCIGSLEPRKGFRDAIWAFDMLRYVLPLTRLTFVGDGPQRSYLQWFAERLETAAQIDFLGQRSDAAQLLPQADICWAPTVTGSSRQVVLEAMAAGRPVVAADSPALREIVTDQETGYMVPAGDKVSTCKRTRGMLLDSALAIQIGAAAQQRVARHFSAEACARRWDQCYTAAA